MTEERYELHYGSDVFSYSVGRDAAINGEIVIEFGRNAMLTVKAPMEAPTDQIVKGVQRKARWIARRFAEHRDQRVNVLTREYVSGETVFYLGRRYILKVIEGSSGRASLIGRHLQVVAETSDQAANSVQSWYRARAERYFETCSKRMADRLEWVTAPPPIALAPMSYQWGSCRVDGTIALNPKLIRADRASIEYVIAHEFCHLRERNHGRRFYQLLEEVLPNWRSAQQSLARKSEMYLAA